MRRRPQPAGPVETAVDLDDESAAEKRCVVTQVEPGVWWLTGTRVEKAAAMTNWDYYEAQARSQRVMVRVHPNPNPDG